jgi:hypothetical protein
MRPDMSFEVPVVKIRNGADEIAEGKETPGLHAAAGEGGGDDLVCGGKILLLDRIAGPKRPFRRQLHGSGLEVQCRDLGFDLVGEVTAGCLFCGPTAEDCGKQHDAYRRPAEQDGENADHLRALHGCLVREVIG